MTMDAAQVNNSIGTAYVTGDGELVVSWGNGAVETFQPQEREFSDGEPLPWFTFLLWADRGAPRSVEIRATSFEAALSILEGRLIDRNYVDVQRITFVDRRPLSQRDDARSRFVRTIGGYAPLAA